MLIVQYCISALYMHTCTFKERPMNMIFQTMPDDKQFAKYVSTYKYDTKKIVPGGGIKNTCNCMCVHR